ncbi:MAG: hypothetical protein ACP5VR_09660 [Acidimicrobiales bacterium]
MARGPGPPEAAHDGAVPPLVSHISPTFGPRQLSAISNSQVVAWHRSLVMKLPGTAPKAYRLMASVMRAAVHDGCIARSPVEVKGASKEPFQEQKAPTVTEVEALAKLAPGRADPGAPRGAGGAAGSLTVCRRTSKRSSRR